MTQRGAAKSKRSQVRRGEARERLLTSARELITARGIDGVSIRAINAAAGVSPGILHYHFGNLDELVLALLGEFMGPLMLERVDMLQHCREEGRSLDTRVLAEVLVMPLARLAIYGGATGYGHVRLLARLYADRSAVLEQANTRWASEFNETIFAALSELFPKVSSVELALRLDMAGQAELRGLSALHQPPLDWQVRRGLSEGIDPWERVRIITDFVAAGLAGARA